ARVDIPERRHVRVAEERIVVEGELRVESQHAPVGRDDQRVELGERAVLGAVAGEEVLGEGAARLLLLPREAEPERQAPGLEGLEAEGGVRPLAQDLLRRPRRDLLDLHPPGLARHDDLGRSRPVERDRQIELRSDGRRFLDEDAADLDALRRRLRGPEPHAQELLRGRLGGRRALRELDAAGLAAPPRVHLRLHHDPAAERPCDLVRPLRAVGDVAPGHRHAELAEQGLGLVFVNLHEAGALGVPRSLRTSHTTGSKNSSTLRSLSGMMPLSVMWMCSGQTSVQHLVMLQSPSPASRRIASIRSRVSRGCISRLASLIKKRGPANTGFVSWSRITWQTSWHRKHSMHLWNSWMRSMSSCIIRYVPSGSGGLSLSGGIVLAFSKLNPTSVTRSRMSGNARIGATVIGSPSAKRSMRVMHISRGWPSISALHDPHLPALQFHRTARSVACVAWRRWITSSTTIPSSASTR